MVDIPLLVQLLQRFGPPGAGTAASLVSPPAPAQVAQGRAPASVAPASVATPPTPTLPGLPQTTPTANRADIPTPAAAVGQPQAPSVPAPSNAVLGMPQNIIPGAGNPAANTAIDPAAGGAGGLGGIGGALQGVQAPTPTPGQTVGTPGPPPQGGNFSNPLLALLLNLTSRGGASQAPTLPSLAQTLR